MGGQWRNTVKKKCPTSTRSQRHSDSHQNKSKQNDNNDSLDDSQILAQVCSNCCSPRESQEIPLNSSQQQSSTHSNNVRAEEVAQSRTINDDLSSTRCDVDLNKMLLTIYNLNFIPPLLQKYPDALSADSQVEVITDFPLCFLCTNLLTPLFSLYNQFNRLRKIESLLSKQINSLNSLINYEDENQRRDQQSNPIDQTRDELLNISMLIINPQNTATTTTVASNGSSNTVKFESNSHDPEPCVWVEIDLLDDLTVEDIGYAPPSLHHLYQEASQGTSNEQRTTTSCHSTETKLEFSSNDPGSWVKVGSRLENLTVEEDCSSLTLDPNRVQEPLQSTIEFSKVFSIPSVVQVANDNDHEMDDEPSPLSDPVLDDDEDVKPHGADIKPELQRGLDSESTNISGKSANKSSTLENSTPINENERNEPAVDEEEKSNVEENEKEPQQKAQSEQDLFKLPCTAVVETGQTENLEKRQLRVRTVPLLVVNTSQASIPPVQNDDDDDDDIDQVNDNDNDDDMDYEPSLSSSHSDHDDETKLQPESMQSENEDVKPDFELDSDSKSRETSKDSLSKSSSLQKYRSTAGEMKEPAVEEHKPKEKNQSVTENEEHEEMIENSQDQEETVPINDSKNVESNKNQARPKCSAFPASKRKTKKRLWGEKEFRCTVDIDDKDKVKCSECNKELENLATLKAHVNRLHTGKKKIPCGFVINERAGQVCPYRARATNLKRHMVTVHADNKDKVKCKECNREFKSEIRLKEHVRHKHTEEGRKLYKLVQQKYLAKLRARTKERNANATKPVCPHCGLDFVNKGECTRHRRSVHDDYTGAKTITVCTLCGKKFEGNVTLKTHMQNVHTDERPFECNKCGGTFKTKQSLRAHTNQTHNEEKKRKRKLVQEEEARKRAEIRNVCPHCGIDFITKIKCTMHRRAVHDDYSGPNARMYVCELCGKKIKGHTNHKVHMQHVHSDERPYICDECGLSYKSKTNLQTHKSRFHTEEGKQKYNDYQRANLRRKKLIREQQARKEADEMDAETETETSDSDSDNEREQGRETAVVTRSSTSTISSTLPPQPTHNT